MASYQSLSKEELVQEREKLLAEYEVYKAMGLKLDMSRGKPGAEQLNLSLPMLDALNSASDFTAEDGTDCRNYGVVDGIPEAKRLMASLMGVHPDEVIVGGNSSMNMMYDAIARAMTHGMCGAGKPWMMQNKVKFLCPVPGYDRHFSVCEHFGIEMINISMNADGPDMDVIERMVNTDEGIKGIWCVPKFSNPSGLTYSDEVVRRFARLSPAAPDFRIFWDNAYFIHDLYEPRVELLNLFEEARSLGKEDMVLMFSSTSKVSYPGAGIAALATSRKNIDVIKKQMSIQTIGYDKMSQLRHARYFKSVEFAHEHMKKHAAILRPKFELVLNEMEQELAPLGIAEWEKPLGGYFISLNTMNGCAKYVVALCKEAGVVLTPAGSAYPYKQDPNDSNIRIAPSFPPLEELAVTAKLLCLCVKLAAAEKLIKQKM
ncbi:MAG: aminotransferase class I/II-fold pyridoxal phosphate-dependent enzyme [Oscillospiraceae bacterium]|nr:aminotransferase class I/II-fold pyridoxal phosphate-dependent enzyme [Oscillospiraceae bacterium]